MGFHLEAPVDGELQNWPKASGGMWSNNVTEGNGRLVFRGDLEFAMDRPGTGAEGGRVVFPHRRYAFRSRNGSCPWNCLPQTMRYSFFASSTNRSAFVSPKCRQRTVPEESSRNSAIPETSRLSSPP